jgi:hypothetical protein
VINGAPQAPTIRDLSDSQETLIDRQRAVGRYDVDVVPLQGLAVPRLLDGERRDMGQQLGHEALVRRIEVYDHDEHEPGHGRHGTEERLEGLEAAR